MGQSWLTCHGHQSTGKAITNMTNCEGVTHSWEFIIVSLFLCFILFFLWVGQLADLIHSDSESENIWLTGWGGTFFTVLLWPWNIPIVPTWIVVLWVWSVHPTHILTWHVLYCSFLMLCVDMLLTSTVAYSDSVSDVAHSILFFSVHFPTLCRISTRGYCGENSLWGPYLCAPHARPMHVHNLMLS